MKKEHNHTTTSNTDEVFSTFIGESLKGILHDRSSGHDYTILVFECGWGLVLSFNGSYWTENSDYVEKTKRRVKEKLEVTQKELEGI